MADLPYVHLHDGDGNLYNAPEDVSVGLSLASFWSSDLESFDVYASDSELARLDRSLASQLPIVHEHNPPIENYSDTNVDFYDRENQVNFLMDLFNQRIEQSSREDLGISLAPIFDQAIPELGLTEDMDLSHLELEIGLGLGLLADDRCDFIAADRLVTSRTSVSGYGESSPDSNGVGVFGLRMTEIGTDSEEEDNEIVGIDLNLENENGLDDNADDDVSLRLCWDSFQLEDHRDANVDFEWEEVDGRLEEREVLNELSYPDGDEDFNTTIAGLIPSQSQLETAAERVDTLRRVDWEVLLNVPEFDSNEIDIDHYNEPYTGDYVYTYDEYDILFSQFVENDNSMVGKPPASRTVIENLPSVVLTKLDVDNDNASCAVCKDEINIGMQAKQLPCSHKYHGDCIIPWLAIRNTCPVCRHELPTDDPDYEHRKLQRLGNIH